MHEDTLNARSKGPGACTIAFRRAILAWFRREARDLSWRRTRDPYSVWLAEIILQQTRVDQGTPYYERFISAFPTVQALAAAPAEAVLKLWEGLGYYTRARNLHRAAKLVVDEHSGQLPACAEHWERLPGVGPYTARAIASIAHGERVPVLDGNVKRVLARLFDIADCVDDARTVEALWALAGTLVPRKSPGEFNEAMMELGARICTPGAPRCTACPVRNYCEARRQGYPELRPVRKAKKKTPHCEMVAGAVCKGGRYLLAKRPTHGLLPGLWEFPSGAVEAGMSHAVVLERHLKEDFGIAVEVGELIATVRHAYSHFQVTLYVYACAQRTGTPRPRTHTAVKWVYPRDFKRYPLPKVNHKFLAALEDR